MENEIKIGKKIFIRNAGKNESWLQDIIYNDPKVLNLGNLIPVNKEKKQPKGGRLDILLKEEEENIMYEVEVMLGETDPSHIIRSIEYWDTEKRRFPQRQHFCVLVAESFDRRYFNIIQLMSLSIPMIAIQVDLLEVNGQKILNFTKIIDVYIEPEEAEGEAKVISESSWNIESPWTNTNAKELLNIIKEINPKVNLGYTQTYISINLDGRNSYWLHKRVKPTSALFFHVTDEEKAEAIRKLLEPTGIDFKYNQYKDFMLNIDVESIKKNSKIFIQIHSIRFQKVTEELE